MSQSGILKISNGNIPGDVATSYVTNSGTAVPIAHVLEVLGAGTTTTSAVGNIITITSSGGGTETLTGNSGGAISPVANNINTIGTGSITIAGSGNTLTTQLTGLTNHNVLVGAGTATITNVAPSATAGFVFASNGSSADPSFQSISSLGGILTITGNSGGAEVPLAGNFNVIGTGSITVAGSTNTETVQLTGLTNHNVLVGAGTATITNVAPSTSGFVLTSNGASSDPSFQAPSSSSVTWTDEAASFAAVNNNGYFVTAVATATLPASPSQGNTISFIVDGTGLLTIQANTGQFIRIANKISASAGTAVNTLQGDSVTLVYRTADTVWIALSDDGGWNVV